MRAAAAVISVAAAVTATAAATARWFPIRRYTIDGPSMEPALHDGDRVLVNRWAYGGHDPRPGDIVVFRDPDRPQRHLIKRVARPPDGRLSLSGACYVLGDNAAMSRDSRHFGAVPRAAIIGRVWREY